MSFLKLENVSKSFGSFKALDDVSFEAPAGAFVVLLGPSGCGKSTLLRLITGLTEDHEGEIYIKDRKVTEDEERKAEDDIQKLTDKWVKEVDVVVRAKEQELLQL